MIKKCPVCLKQYEGRRDKVACSDRCKKRVQRAPTTEQMLKNANIEAAAALRYIGTHVGDYQHGARAHNSLKGLIREMCAYLPGYERTALAAELRESVGGGGTW